MRQEGSITTDWPETGLPEDVIPWGDRPSLFGFVVEHLDETGRYTGGELPDEVRGEGVRWAAGAQDGVATHHFDVEPGGDRVAMVERLLRVALDDPAAAKLEGLYTVLLASDVLSVLDPLMDRLRDDPPDPDSLERVGRWLATRAPDRGPVKIGMAMLGLVLDHDNQQILERLGRHDEFTLYTAVALTSSLEDPEPALFDLARDVHGWGRIHVVERLFETDDPKIQGWLLRQGFRNDVMNAYLALGCALAGDLRDALAADDVDDALMEGARDILLALCALSPAGDLFDYEPAPEVIRSWLGHLARRPHALADFVALVELREWLGFEDGDGDWSPFELARTVRDLEARIASADYRPLVEAGLRSRDRQTRWMAGRGADALGIDAWPDWFAHLEAGADVWAEVCQTDDPERFDRVLDVAREQLDLDALGSGSDHALGIGPGAEPYFALEEVLQGCRSFLGRGTPFVLAGLACPVVRVRHRALEVLDAWGIDRWPSEVTAALERLRPDEVDDKVRAGMTALLAGQRLPADEEEP